MFNLDCQCNGVKLVKYLVNSFLVFHFLFCMLINNINKKIIIMILMKITNETIISYINETSLNITVEDFLTPSIK